MSMHLNCSSLTLPASPCSPPCGGSLPAHGTCAGPVQGGYHRPDRYGDRLGQPRPHKPPRMVNPGAYVRKEFHKRHGCDPLDFCKPASETRPIEPSSLPELVTRPSPERSWTEWYMGLPFRTVAWLDDAMGTLFPIPSPRLPAADLRPAPEEPGQGGIVMLNFDEPVSGVSAARYRHYIHQVAGQGTVQLIDGEFDHSSLYPYVRNLAIEANGVILGSGYCHSSSHEQTRSLIEAHCKRLGIPYQRLASGVNFANVEYVPSRELLIIASSHVYPATRSARDELSAAFGHPKHVLHVELDLLPKNEYGGLSCYDLDMALHITRDAEGNPVAMVYPDCLRVHPDIASSGRREFLLALHELGIKLVEVSESDQRKLATNAVSWGLPRGEILLPHPSVSDELKRALQAAGVRPSFPRRGDILGGVLRDFTYFGLHCMTLHLPQAERKAGHS